MASGFRSDASQVPSTGAGRGIDKLSGGVTLMVVGLNRAVRSGALWAYGSQVALTILQFAAGVVLARLLGPSEFGVFIAVTAFTSIGLVVCQFGLPQALVQAKQVSSDQINAAFALIVILGAVLVGLIFWIAQPLAELYREPRMAPVMQAMSLLLILTSVAGVGMALLRRDLLFNRAARISIAASVVGSGSSIVAAAADLGVYSLVIGAVMAMLVTIHGVLTRGDWWPSPAPLLAVRPLLAYGGFTMINNTLEIAILRVDNMIVGWVSGVAGLGIYNRAYSLARLPSDQFAESIGPLLLSALSRASVEPEQARTLFLSAVCAVFAVTTPFLALLLIAGPQLVLLLYGDAWMAVGPPLQIMVLGGFFVVLTSMLQRYAYALNLVRTAVRVNLVMLAATVCGVLVAASFGLVVVAIAMVAREALWSLMLFGLQRRSVAALGAPALVRAAAPALWAGVGAVAAGLLAASLPFGAGAGAGEQLVALSVTGVGVFSGYILVLLALMLFWKGNAELQSLRRLLLGLIPGLRRRA